MKNKFITQTQQWDYSVLHTNVLIHKKQIIASFNLEETLDYNILTSVYVNENFRGKGYGSLIVQTALEAAKFNGYQTLYLSVKKTNKTAIKLYKKFGFIIEDNAENSRYHWMKKEIK